MRIEMRRTFPVPRKVGFDYVTDFHTWGEWIDLDLIEDEKASWAKKGDTVPFVYRMAGVPMKGMGKLDKIVPGEMVRAIFKVGMLPEMMNEVHFENAGAHAFTLIYVVDVAESVNWWEKAIETATMRKPLLKGQMRMWFDHLDEVFLEKFHGKDVHKIA